MKRPCIDLFIHWLIKQMSHIPKNRHPGKHCTFFSTRARLFFFVPYFSARLDFTSHTLSAPGSPRMFR